jgi:hypothetical protein
LSLEARECIGFWHRPSRHRRDAASAAAGLLRRRGGRVRNRRFGWDAGSGRKLVHEERPSGGFGKQDAVFWLSGEETPRMARMTRCDDAS